MNCCISFQKKKFPIYSTNVKQDMCKVLGYKTQFLHS